MKIKKIKIEQEQTDINFKFYFFLKELNSSTSGLTQVQIDKSIELLSIKSSFIQSKQLLEKYYEDNIVNESKRENILTLLFSIENEKHLYLFSFALKMLVIKPLLLEEAKLIMLSEPIDEATNQLSLKYDTYSKSRPYYVRVNGALMSLFFFSEIEKRSTGFLSEATDEFVRDMIEEYSTLKKAGLEPNQIFMLMFTESVNQSILSSAGSSYEDRLMNVLIAIGINKNSISKIHDEKDTSTEFDMFFSYKNKTYGISAKRTLRERYKQSIKTSMMSKIDVMIQVTLGIDLTETKARAIRRHGLYLFVADEVYMAKSYLQNIEGIFPASSFSLNQLKKLP